MWNVNQIGEVSVKGVGEVEWILKDFFTYTTEDTFYNSPTFDVSGLRWYLRISPNGRTVNNSAGWIGLHLHRENSSLPQGVIYNFGLKRADGTFEILKKDFVWVFDNATQGYGSSSCWQRSELQRRRSELMPSDVLTVTCTLRVHKSVVFSERLDTLSRNLLDMFTSKKGCDVTLKVKNEEFPVHKFILSARSPVFAAMFEVDMKEKITDIVDIVDCDPEAFENFLTYLYSGTVENPSSNPFELYKIADKYDVEELKSDCLISIMTNLNVENVFEAVSFGDQFSLKALEIKTKVFFNDNFKKIAHSAEWESFLVSNVLLANQLLKSMASKMK